MCVLLQTVYDLQWVFPHHVIPQRYGHFRMASLTEVKTVHREVIQIWLAGLIVKVKKKMFLGINQI